MEQLHIIKIGGNVIDNETALTAFLKKLATIEGYKILIHGGGKLATELAQKLGIEQTLIEGRRLTNAPTLDIATMVYAGLINKKIVAQLQNLHCNAIGLCGADANLITTTKRNHPTIDYGFVGDVTTASVNVEQCQFFLENNMTLVLSAITHNGEGILLNTNADTIAATMAIALAKLYQVNLLFCFEKNGVLTNVDDEHSFIAQLNQTTYQLYKDNNIINKGMIPKLDNAFAAKTSGVQQVRVCSAENILNPTIGTVIV
jgi:acetylglutamate kinase